MYVSTGPISLDSVIITDGYAFLNGGVIYAYYADVDLTNVTVEDSWFSSAGGIVYSAGIY
jgi:hypothetical protein